MWRAILALAVLMSAGDKPVSVKADPVFLTRDGCVNTPHLVNNLDDALTALGWAADYPIHQHRKAAREGCPHGLPDTDAVVEGERYLRDARSQTAA
jgi:hypothetical protein